MAWNRSQGDSQAKDSPRRAGTAVAVRGAIAGAIVVLGAGIAAWWLWPKEVTRQGVASPKKAHIKEVTPTAAPKYQPAPVATNLPLNMKRDHSELSREDLLKKVPHWAYTVEDRKRLDPGYEKRHEKFLAVQEANPWKSYADRSLAFLLFNNGNLAYLPPFDARYKELFLESLKTPIIATKDDPPELQEQKRQMNETKIWLKERLDAGEDIVAILNDEYKHQKKISGLRDSLKRELFQLQKTAKSVQEVEDYIAAANMMLEKEGATSKIKMSTMPVKIRLQRAAAQNNGGTQK